MYVTAIKKKNIVEYYYSVATFRNVETKFATGSLTYYNCHLCILWTKAKKKYFQNNDTTFSPHTFCLDTSEKKIGS